MKREMTDRQRQAREFRMQGLTLDAIGRTLNISKQGARYLLIAGDRYADVKISSLKDYKRWKNERK